MIETLPDRSSVTGDDHEIPRVAELDSRSVFAGIIQFPNLGSSFFSTQHHVSVVFEEELVGIGNRGSSVRRPDQFRAAFVDDAECEQSDGCWRGYETEAEVWVVGFEEETVVVDVIHLRSSKTWIDAPGVRYTGKQRIREEDQACDEDDDEEASHGFRYVYTTSRQELNLLKKT